MKNKQSINVIQEFTQLTTHLLTEGYNIIDVQQDPNKRKNQAIVMSKDIHSAKGQDIIVLFKLTSERLEEPYSRTVIVDNYVGRLKTKKHSDWASYWNQIYTPSLCEIIFHEQLKFR